MNEAREDVRKRWDLYKQMAAIQYKADDTGLINHFARPLHAQRGARRN